MRANPILLKLSGSPEHLLGINYHVLISTLSIIAVHGLGANVDWSWTWKDEAKPDHHVKWLEDEDMLPAVVPKSRIVLYNYDSSWHSDAPKTRLQICGEELLCSIHTFRKDVAHRPVIFIGHSLGGNVIEHVSYYRDSPSWRTLQSIRFHSSIVSQLP